MVTRLLTRPLLGEQEPCLTVVTAAATTGLHLEQVEKAGLTRGHQVDRRRRCPPSRRPRRTESSELGSRAPCRLVAASWPRPFSEVLVLRFPGSEELQAGLPDARQGSLQTWGALVWELGGRVLARAQAHSAVVWQHQQAWWRPGCPLLDRKRRGEACAYVGMAGTGGLGARRDLGPNPVSCHLPALCSWTSLGFSLCNEEQITSTSGYLFSEGG